jgi:outer membrane protein TolC
VDLFGKAESYNSPTNLRPMPPTEAAAGGSLPFSRNLVRYGLSFQAPLYIAKIYRLREKMNLLSKKSAIARQINLVSREAAVVSLNSAYHYLFRLNEAVDARLKSLAKTRSDVELKVKNGRTPEAELMKIDNSIIALDEQKNDLADKMLNVQRDLEKFTGLSVTAPVDMDLLAAPAGTDLIAIKLQKTDLAAQEKEMERVRAQRLPAVSLYGTVSGNDGEAYNTDSHVFRAYNFVGLGLNMPLFDKILTTDEDIARIQVKKAAKKLRDTEIELTALEKNLKNRLPIVEKSHQLADKSVANNNQLLKIARVSYDSGRTTTEEYLRYEAQVLAAQADLARAADAKWQIFTKQAVIYGTDLRGVVK